MLIEKFVSQQWEKLFGKSDVLANPSALKCYSMIITCYVLLIFFLPISGWKISDVAIRAGLEHTYLLGRSQILTSKEAEALGLPGATVLLDGGFTGGLYYILYLSASYRGVQLLVTKCGLSKSFVSAYQGVRQGFG